MTLLKRLATLTTIFSLALSIFISPVQAPVQAQGSNQLDLVNAVALTNSQALPVQQVVKIYAGSSQSGSGIVIDAQNRYVLTNAHVVLDAYSYRSLEDFSICTVESEQSTAKCDFTAKLLVADVDSDLALLKVNETKAATAFNKAIDIYAKSDAVIGDKLSILGFPGLGGETITASQGIVSGFVVEGDEVYYLKTDSALIAGNSGGLAIDEEGNFLGMPSAYLSSHDGEANIGLIISRDFLSSWFTEIRTKVGEPTTPLILTSFPGEITDFKAQKTGSDKVKLTWYPSVSTYDVVSHDVVYDTRKLTAKEVQDFANNENKQHYIDTKSGDNSYVVTGLDSSKTYYFWVRPFTEKGDTSYWREVSIDLGSGQSGRIFPDVSTDHKNIRAITVLKEAITVLKDAGVISGYPDGTFQPDRTLQRGELMKIVVEADGVVLDNALYNNCFTDVHDEWFAAYVCYAKQKGWITGYSDGSFHPANEVNLAEALKMIESATNLNPDDVAMGANFPEELKNQWYTTFLNTANEFNLLGEDIRFVNADTKVTRANASEYLYRALQISEYRKDFTSQTWKDTQGKNVGIEYSGYADGVKGKYELTQSDGAVVYKTYSINKGCASVKNTLCYTVKVKESDGTNSDTEVKIENGSALVVKETANIAGEDKTINYSEPFYDFKGANILNFIKFDQPVVIEFEGIKMEVADLVQLFSYTDREKVDTLWGEREAIMYTSVQGGVATITLKDGKTELVIARNVTVVAVVDGIGPIYTETSLSTWTLAGAKISEENSTIRLVEWSK